MVTPSDHHDKAVQAISGRTPLTLTINSWWQVTILVLVLASLYFGLSTRIEEAIRIGTQVSDRNRELERELFDMQKGQIQLSDDLRYFRAQHERDMEQLKESIK